MYSRLFEPGKIGSMQLKNRIVMAPMGNVADVDGGYSQRQIDYYAARAKGGAGLIITGSVFFTSLFGVPPSGILDKGIHVARLNELSEQVHRYGAKLALQFNLGGGRCGGMVSASEVPTVADPSVKTRAITRSEIQEIVRQAGASAKLAKQGGADAIMLHAYAGYLLDQFQSAQWNHRTDEYGGSLENRMRLTCELIASIKSACGERFPVMVKFSVDHGTQDGRKLEEGLAMCRILESAGCDGMLVDTGSFETQWNRCIPTVYEPEGYSLEMTAKVHQAVSYPVIGQNKLSQPAVAEEALESGACDFVALGHALLSDPEWPNKVMRGEEEDIRPCIGCNNCLLSTNQSRYYQCAVNPWLSHETDPTLQVKATKKPKRILVVGGGPAGMVAAQIAATCGHQVELWERSKVLGGNLLAASAPTFKKDVASFTSYLEHKTETAGITIKLGREATAENIEQEAFDFVILATGARAAHLAVQGAENPNVMTSLDVLTGKAKPGHRVAVIGGGLVGCETASSLAEQGHKVTIVEYLPSLLSTGEEARNNALALRALISRLGISSICSAAVQEVTLQGVRFQRRESGEVELLECDSVVEAIGFRSNDSLVGKLKARRIPAITIGDASAPRKIRNAVLEGLTAVLDLEDQENHG